MGFPEGNQILYAPKPIRHASSHCWTHPKCTMNFDEVVGEIVQRNGSRVILHLAREPIRQARIATHCAACCPVLPFNKASRNMLWVRATADFLHLAADALRGRIASIGVARCAIDFV